MSEIQKSQNPSSSKGRGLLIALVCGCLVAIVLGSVGAISMLRGGNGTVPNAPHVGNDRQERREQAEFAADWDAPPAGANADMLLPLDVEGSSRTSAGTINELYGQALEQEGFIGIYDFGGIEVDVVAVPVDESLKQTVFEAAKRKVANEIYTVNISDSPHQDRFSYRISPPFERAILWWNKGWLFVIRTESFAAIDLEQFQRDLLEGVDELVNSESAGSGEATGAGESGDDVQN